MAPVIAQVAIKQENNKMSKSSKKVKRAKLSGHGRGLEGSTGRFWTQWIEPKRVAFISENLMPVHLVIKNHGPGPVFLAAEQGKQMDLGPGAVHATYACGTVWVENRDEKSSVLIEFDFLPIFRK
jgi:hypothetical protein